MIKFFNLNVIKHWNGLNSSTKQYSPVNLVTLPNNYWNAPKPCLHFQLVTLRRTINIHNFCAHEQHWCVLVCLRLCYGLVDFYLGKGAIQMNFIQKKQVRQDTQFCTYEQAWVSLTLSWTQL